VIVKLLVLVTSSLLSKSVYQKPQFSTSRPTISLCVEVRAPQKSTGKCGSAKLVYMCVESTDKFQWFSAAQNLFALLLGRSFWVLYFLNSGAQENSRIPLPNSCFDDSLHHKQIVPKTGVLTKKH
jgi:hypothetical protein